MSAEDRIERSRLCYEQFVFGGDVTALATAERELDAVEADLALARGRVMHGRFLAQSCEDPQELSLFERAAQLHQMLGDVRGLAESLFWVGIFHQVVRHDNDAAVPAFERSHELAAQLGDLRTLSYVLRHLGIAEHAAGRLNKRAIRITAVTGATPARCGGARAASPRDRASGSHLLPSSG